MNHKKTQKIVIVINCTRAKKSHFLNSQQIHWTPIISAIIILRKKSTPSYNQNVILELLENIRVLKLRKDKIKVIQLTILGHNAPIHYVTKYKSSDVILEDSNE